ncbi:Lrp/AsnC family transcriptional regulator [Streptomyces atratus]
MITAIVLIKTSVDRIPEIAEAIAALDSVSEVFSVTGTYDLIAMVRVAKHDDLADVIPGRISKIPGVEATDTHVAFRTYSQRPAGRSCAEGCGAETR